jgi:hypothetical protein
MAACAPTVTLQVLPDHADRHEVGQPLAAAAELNSPEDRAGVLGGLQ